MNPLVVDFEAWNENLIIDSFKNTGFLVVNKPFKPVKESLNLLRDTLKYTDLKTFPAFWQGRPSKQNHPGQANERVERIEFESKVLQQCVHDVKEQFVNVSIKIFHAIEKFMLMPHNTIAEKHYPDRDPTLCYVKYYKDQEGDIRMGSHCDFGTLTLVHVCNPVEEYQLNKNDEWHTIRYPSDDFIIVNIGDMMQLWTDNKLPSTRHRVANTTKKERTCLISFMHPVNSEKIKGYYYKDWVDFKSKTALSTG